MAWNGARPYGPVLFESFPLTTSVAWQPFSISLNTPTLVRDQPYVVCFTANNFLDGIRSDARMGGTDNLYQDGTFVAHYGGSSFNDLLTQDWTAPFWDLFDLAIRLEYQPVPEPSPLALLAMGLLTAGICRFRR